MGTSPQPPCLRFAMAVAGHHPRLSTRLRARLCRGLHFRRLNFICFKAQPPRNFPCALRQSGPATGAAPVRLCTFALCSLTFDLLFPALPPSATTRVKISFSSMSKGPSAVGGPQAVPSVHTPAEPRSVGAPPRAPWQRAGTRSASGTLSLGVSVTTGETPL